MRSYDYEQSVKLRHHEKAAVVDQITGEVREVNKRPNNIPEGKEVWLPKEPFFKQYPKTWEYLTEVLTPMELKVTLTMAIKSRMNSNSLEPLSNSSTKTEIAEEFGIHRNHVAKIFNNLMRHGVYAEFRFGDRNGEIKHYWVLNPWISFKGKTVSKALIDLFRETKIADLYQ